MRASAWWVSILLAPCVAAGAPVSLWKIALPPGGAKRLVVDGATGRMAVIGGVQVVVVDRMGHLVVRQPVPATLGPVEAGEVGPYGGVFVGTARGALLLGAKGGVVPLLLPDVKPRGAAADASGGWRICAEAGDGTGVVLGVGADGRRRYTLPLTGVMHPLCRSVGVAGDGTLYVAGGKVAVAVTEDGRVARRWDLSGEAERAPVADGEGALVQTSDGLTAIDRRGGVAWTAPSEDGVVVHEGRLMVQNGRHLAWLDRQGKELFRSSALEPPEVVERAVATPLEEELPSVGPDGSVLAPAGEQVVLLDRDGRERFRRGLPGARGVVMISAQNLAVLTDEALEGVVMPTAALRDLGEAARDISADPSVPLEAKVAAWGRALAQAGPKERGALERAAAADSAALGTSLAVRYKGAGHRRGAVLDAIDELGELAWPSALAVIAGGVVPDDGPRAAALAARGGDRAVHSLKKLLERKNAPVAAAHALGLVALKSGQPESLKGALLGALAGPEPRLTCAEVRADEQEALAALVEALAWIGPRAASGLSDAVKRRGIEECRASALRQAMARVAPTDEALAQLRKAYFASGELDEAELKLAEGLGPQAGAALADLIGRPPGKPETTEKLVEVVGRLAQSGGAAANMLLLLTAGKRPAPPEGRAQAIRAAAGLPAKDLAPAVAAGLRDGNAPGEVVEALCRAAGRARSPSLVRSLADVVSRGAPGPTKEALRALAAIDPARAGSEALAIAGDERRGEEVRLFAIRVAARVASPTLRAPLEKVAEVPGAVGQAAARSLTPWVGLHLDEGLRVTSVEPHSPALRAEVRLQDRVITANGRAYDRLPPYELMQGHLRLGDALVLTVERGGQRREIRVMVGGAMEQDGDLFEP